MAFELTVLLGAIASVRALVHEGTALVDSIHKGMGGRNEAAKEKLAGNLRELEDRLKGIGKVAEVAESYFRTQENVAALLSIAQRLSQFIDDNSLALDQYAHPDSKGSWHIVNLVYRQLGEASDAPQKVLLDRSEWYDDRDKAQIAGKLKDFSAAYDRAKGYVDSKQRQAVQNELEQMIRPLGETSRLLSSTLYDEILRNLQSLRA
jgi:hypothetical protein